MKRFASPRTPAYALDNTGVAEWSVGATTGLVRGRNDVKLSYSHYDARLGVCNCLHVESAEAFFAGIAADRPLAWLRMEGSSSEEAQVRLREWPGGEDVLLGRCHWHGAWVAWEAPGL